MSKFIKKHFFKLIYLFIIGIIIWLYCIVFSGISDARKNNTDDDVYENNINNESNMIEESLTDKMEDSNIENTVSDNTVGDNSNNITTEEPVKKNYEVLNTESGDVYSVIGTLRIEKIGLEMEITSKTTDELMLYYACRVWGPDPNEVGNLCITGHNWLNTKLFSKVPYLEVGDTFDVIDVDNNSVTYRIYDKYLVYPDDTECLNQNTNGKRIVTLITCTNDSSQRYIFHAEAI